MATKYLARTAIEGGRRNTWERRQTNVEERADTRVYLQRLKTEDADGLAGPIRRPEHKEFSDKLNPAIRFLKTHVGDVWNDVHSELISKFDSRTTAGRHILYDHILRNMVTVDQEYGYNGRGTFWVDDNGILCGGDTKRMYRTQKQKIEQRVTYRSEDGVKTWLNGRYVEENNGKLWWTTPTSRWYKKCEERGCAKPHPKSELVDRPTELRPYNKGRDWDGFELPLKLTRVNYHEVFGACKRTEKLNEKDLAYWKTLHPVYKDRILEKNI